MSTFNDKISNGDGVYTLAPDENAIDMGLEPVEGQEGYWQDADDCYYVQNGRTISFVAGNGQAFADYLRH